MKISEKIIRFADGEMSPVEKAEFEKELKNSPSLQEEYNIYKSLLANADETKNIRVDQNYFTSIIPVFRIKHAGPKRLKLFPKIALGVSLVTTLIVFFTIFNNSNNESLTEKTLVEYSAREIDSVLNNYPQYNIDIDAAVLSADTNSTVVDDMLMTELNVTQDNLESISPYLPNTYINQNIIPEISDKEADIVYNEILKKNYF